jgi:hypothetical protein
MCFSFHGFTSTNEVPAQDPPKIFRRLFIRIGAPGIGGITQWQPVPDAIKEDLSCGGDAQGRIYSAMGSANGAASGAGFMGSSPFETGFD